MMAKYRNPSTGEIWDSETGEVTAGQSAPDYRQAFQPEGNALADYANAGAFQLDKFMRGGQNLYAKATGNEVLQGQLQAEQAQRDPYMQQLQERSPIASTLGQMAPGMATAAIPGGLMAQTAIGAGLGALDYSQEQGTQAVTGGLLSAGGYGVGKAIGKGYNVVRGAMKSDAPSLAQGMRGDMVKKAKELGMELMPGHESGARVQQQIDVGIKRSPVLSGLAEEGLEKNTRILNRAAIEAMGEAGDEVNDGMLARAAKRIGEQYDSLLNNVDEIRIDPLAIDEATDNMAQDSLPYIKKYLERFPSLQDGKISGKEAGRLRNLIQKDVKLVRNNFKADPDDLNAFQDILLSAAEEASGTSKDVLKTAGMQWRVMKALERAKTVSGGNVNPASMATGLKQYGTTFKRGLLEGQKIDPKLEKLYDAVKVSEYFKDIVGDSGTPTALQAAEYLDPKTFMQRQLMRRAAKSYLENGGANRSMGMLQGLQQPANPASGQLGAGLLRGLYTGQ